MTDEPGQPDPSGKVRASDAEREAVVERLREATAQGRLTFEVPHGNVDITATAVMGDVKVIGDSYAEPARRTLRAWITRDDRDRRAIE